MAAVLEDVAIDPLVLRLPPGLEMTDDQFLEFCSENRPWRMERTADGDILIMAPEGGEGGSQSSELNHQLRAWAKRDGSGIAFGSSAGFKLPNSAIRNPDAAWVAKSRLRHLTRDQKKKFLPLCPDFVVELLSPTDRLSRTKQKMQEYIDNGAQLGWLIDPMRKQVHIYRPRAEFLCLDSPETLAGDPELPGFVLDLRDIWDPGF